MRVGKWDGKGKFHITRDVYNNKTLCNRYYLLRDAVSEIKKDEFKKLLEEEKVCRHCYKPPYY